MSRVVFRLALVSCVSAIVGPSLPADGFAGVASPQTSLAPEQIVFVSERDGNREIYRVSADRSEATNLTNHPARDQSPAVSADRRQIAFMSNRSGEPALWVADANGDGARMVAELPQADFGWAWSPDGKTIAWSYQRPDDRTHDLAIIDVASGEHELLTNTAGVDEITPEWSPDGQRLLFFRDDEVGPRLYSIGITDRTVTLLVDRAFERAAYPRVSPDGARVLVRVHNGSDFDTVEIDTRSGAVAQRLVGPTNDWGAAWSPSGTHIVFHSDRAEGYQLFMLDVASGAVQQVTREGAPNRLPTWR